MGAICQGPAGHPGPQGRTAATAADLRRHWAGARNVLLAGECAPFAWEPPPVADIVDRLRRDDDARLRDLSPDRPDGPYYREDGFIDQFRALPLERVMEMPFGLSHFSLTNFTSRGDLFAGLWTEVMEPWQAFLARAGFTWYRCYPIVFISGAGVPGRYHMDVSHVVAWQLHGTKVFNGLLAPYRWAPLEQAVDPDWRAGMVKPADLRDGDVLSYVMPPGAVLWNQPLTPHWVDAGGPASGADGVAASLNISHGGSGSTATCRRPGRRWTATTANTRTSGSDETDVYLSQPGGLVARSENNRGIESLRSGRRHQPSALRTIPGSAR